MEIINFEIDKIINIEMENGSVTLYFLNGNPNGKTYPYSAFSVSEKLFIVDWFKKQLEDKYEEM